MVAVKHVQEKTLSTCCDRTSTLWLVYYFILNYFISLPLY